MTVLVPAADLAPSLASRLVTITIASMTEGAVDGLAPTVSFRLYGDIHVGADRVIVASLPAPVTVDLSTGSASIRLPVFDGRFGGQWAIAVKKSWAPHEYLIRIPSGTGPIDLSELAPLGPLDLAGGPGPSGQIGTGGLPPGGMQGDVLLVTAEGLKWAKLSDLYDGSRMGRWEPSGRVNLVDSTFYEAFPRAAILPDGRLMMARQTGTGHTSGQTGRMRISSDGGVTWGADIVPLTGETGAWGVTSIATLGSRIALMTMTSAPYAGWIQVSTSPTTWPAKRPISWGSTGWTFPCDMVWLADGTADGLMLAVCYGGEGVLVTASANAGATWIRRATPLPAGQGWSESTITRVGDRLMMLARNDVAGQPSYIAQLWSDDWGVTWSTPRTAIQYCSGLPLCTVMRDGTLLVTLRDQTGLAHESWTLGVSRDAGQTWSKQLVDDSWMMYGQVVQLPGPTADGILIGSSQTRGSSTDANVWRRRLTLSPGRVVDAVAVDQLRADLISRKTYTPVWYTGAAITLGNGSTTGSYTQIGDQVEVELLLVTGTTTVVTAGSQIQVTLPVAAGGLLTAEGYGSTPDMPMIGARKATHTIVTITKPGALATGADIPSGTTLVLRIKYRL